MKRLLLYSSTFLFTTIVALTVYLAWEREMYGKNGSDSGSEYSVRTASKPSPSLSARQVVEIQLNALQHNDLFDRGIRRAFYFTTTFNTEGRKSYGDFQKLLRSKQFAHILNHRYVKRGSLKYYQNKAFQVIAVVDQDNNIAEYLFELVLQKESPSKGCWLTKSVRIIREENPFYVI